MKNIKFTEAGFEFNLISRIINAKAIFDYEHEEYAKLTMVQFCE